MLIRAMNRSTEIEKLPLVSFGKYKNRPVAEMMADQKYIQWCLSQPWFHEKPIYNIVMNINPNKDTPTPEHNRLQNCFLDDEFIKKFHYYFHPKSFAGRKDFDNLKNDEERLGYVKQKVTHVESEKINKYIISGQKIIAECGPSFDTWTTELIDLKYDLKISKEFETVNGWDVWLGIEGDFVFSKSYKEYIIEIKPTVGDDYPCILRKMKTSLHKLYSQPKTFRTKVGIPVLLIGQFESKYTTYDQLKEIFSLAGIKVVKYDDILLTN